MSVKNTDPTEALLQEIFKNACMGSDSITTLIGKTKDSKFLSDLTAQLSGYQNFANSAREKLTVADSTAKAVPVTTKVPAEMGIMMNTMIDSSTSHIAEMMINGSTMGIIDIKRAANKACTDGAAKDAVELANDLVTFEENNINKLKEYL